MEPTMIQEPIHIVTQDGMTLTFMVFLRMNVQDLKEKLVERLGLDMEEIHNIRLYYRGRTLNNMYTLEECNVTKGAVIYQIDTVRGSTNASSRDVGNSQEHKMVVPTASMAIAAAAKPPIDTSLFAARLNPAGSKPGGKILGLF